MMTSVQHQNRFRSIGVQAFDDVIQDDVIRDDSDVTLTPDEVTLDTQALLCVNTPTWVVNESPEENPNDGITTNSTGTKWRYLREVWTTFCASLGALSMGTVLAYTSPAIPDLIKEGLLTEAQAAWLGALLTPGALAGTYLAAGIAERYGRKASILSCAVPYTLGWLLIAAAHNIALLYSGRILTGVGAGMTTLCVPVYIAEISSKQIRGVLGVCFRVGNAVGVLVANAMGLILPWRWLAVFCASIPTTMVILMQTSPETPRYLLMKNQAVQAAQSLSTLRRRPSMLDPGVIHDLQEIAAKIHVDTAETPMSWSEFKQPYLYKPLAISLSLMFLQQFCGINIVNFYTETLFLEAGFFRNNPGIPAVILSTVKVVGTCCAALLMDHVGRRVLFLTAGLLLTISCTTFGVYFYITSHHITEHNISWLSLASLNLYAVAQSLAWGSIPWLITSEIFPTRARGRAASVATAFNWLCAFVVTLGFLPLQGVITIGGVFWVIGGICFLGTVVMYLVLPETNGRTLEELQDLFGAPPNRNRDRSFSTVGQR